MTPERRHHLRVVDPAMDALAIALQDVADLEQQVEFLECENDELRQRWVAPMIVLGLVFGVSGLLVGLFFHLIVLYVQSAL